MLVTLRPLRTYDTGFVTYVRNQCSHLLHDDRQFSLLETHRWYTEQKPKWFCIQHREGRVGYVRTSTYPAIPRSMSIGCDIMTGCKRRGYATAAYDILFNTLIKRGPYCFFNCQILSHNLGSLAFALNYGFHIYDVETRFCKRDNRMVDNLYLSLNGSDR